MVEAAGVEPELASETRLDRRSERRADGWKWPRDACNGPDTSKPDLGLRRAAWHRLPIRLRRVAGGIGESPRGKRSAEENRGSGACWLCTDLQVRLDVGAEVPGSAGQLEHGFIAGTIEQVVDDPLVAERQRREFMGKREDEVEILHGQQFCGARLKPLEPCVPLALRGNADCGT